MAGRPHSAEVPKDCATEVRGLLTLMRKHLKARGALDRTVSDLSDRIELLSMAYADPEPREIAWQRAGFTMQEARVVAILKAHLGVAVSRVAILDAMYFDREAPEGERKSLDVHLCRIRRKLKRVEHPYRVETVWAFGFRMVALS